MVGWAHFSKLSNCFSSCCLISLSPSSSSLLEEQKAEFISCRNRDRERYIIIERGCVYALYIPVLVCDKGLGKVGSTESCNSVCVCVCVCSSVCEG